MVENEGVCPPSVGICHWRIWSRTRNYGTRSCAFGHNGRWRRQILLMLLTRTRRGAATTCTAPLLQLLAVILPRRALGRPWAAPLGAGWGRVGRYQRAAAGREGLAVAAPSRFAVQEISRAAACGTSPDACARRSPFCTVAFPKVGIRRVINARVRADASGCKQRPFALELALLHASRRGVAEGWLPAAASPPPE